MYFFTVTVYTYCMIVQCNVCGADFVTYPSKIARGRGKYCSRSCSMPVTNKALKKAGEVTRFVEGQEAHNKQGYTYTIARKGGNKYRLILKPEHPLANKRGYVREHRLVMSEHLGRPLSDDEVVHHIDENPMNNSIDNLELMSGADHRRIHLKDNVHRRWFDANSRAHD